MTVVGNIPIGEPERTTPLSNFSQTGSPIDIIYRKSQPSTPRNTVNSNRVPHLKKPEDFKFPDTKNDDNDTNNDKNNDKNNDYKNNEIHNPESALSTSPSLTKRPSNLTLYSTSSQDNEANI